MLAFIEQRDPERPFFAFQFFESPHAQYDFPEECAVFEPCIDGLNYAALDLERDIAGIRNRYLNSCRHLDQQIGRVTDFLEQRGLMQRTILVVTGDHGEEFMEHGAWGHGSSFVDEQVRVPLLLWIPGVEAGVTDRLTSHLDLPATLLPRLGVHGDEADLSLGHDLLGPHERDFTVVCDWNRLCYVDADFKAWFDLKRVGFLGNQITTGDDRPEADRDAFLASRGAALAEVMADLARFRRRPGTLQEPSGANRRQTIEPSFASRSAVPDGPAGGPAAAMD
jgi:membrane-anchored protein YejM (alkaline phosphatase superfamily)